MFIDTSQLFSMVLLVFTHCNYLGSAGVKLSFGLDTNHSGAQSLEQSTIKQENRGRGRAEMKGRGNNSLHCVCRHMVRPVLAGLQESAGQKEAEGEEGSLLNDQTSTSTHMLF